MKLRAAAQYLGALTLDEALEAPARALAEATSGDTLKAMLARYLAEYDGAPRPRPRCARCQPQWRAVSTGVQDEQEHWIRAHVGGTLLSIVALATTQLSPNCRTQQLVKVL